MGGPQGTSAHGCNSRLRGLSGRWPGFLVRDRELFHQQSKRLEPPQTRDKLKLA